MDMTVVAAAFVAAAIPAGASIMTTRVVHSKSIALMAAKIDNLTEKVEKHNGVVERVYKCEADIRILESKVDDTYGT